MQEADEQDTCRICSAPAEPDQPLFHPCKCSGTIRYIHQDCLTTWLSHSKKKTCDVCKYPYSFTKVYAENMPSRLPAFLLVRRMIQQGLLGVLFAIRLAFVTFLWLAFLPWATVWTWRMYFSVGESTAWMVSAIPNSISSNYSASHYITAETPMPPPKTIIGRIASHPTYIALSADIFTGQIIASLIVLIFIAIFLLREYIVQHVRPGFFDDEDEVLEERPEPQPPVDPQPLVPIMAQPPELPLMDVNERLHLAPGQIEAMRALQAMHGGEAPAFPQLPLGRDRMQRRAYLERGPRHISASEAHRRAQALATIDHRVDMSRQHHQVPDQKIQETVMAGSNPPRPEISGSVSDGYEESTRPGRSYANPIPESDSDEHSFEEPWEPSPSSQAGPSLRRPPLPTSTTPLAGPSGSRSLPASPLSSPNLATYQPPENVVDYFESETDALEKSEFDKFFPLVPLGSVNSPAQDLNNDGDDFANGLRGEETEEEEEERNVNQIPIDEIAQWYEDDDGEGGEEEEEDEENGRPLPQILEPVQLEPPLVAHPIAGVVPARPPVAADPRFLDIAPIPAELMQDLEGGEDDMDGAWEAIGIRGSLFGAIQNAALMIFLLDTAIGLGVWAPFTLGKTFALLTLNPQRFLDIVHFPIRIIRLFTDPFVDGFIYVLFHMVVPPYTRLTLRGLCYISQRLFQRSETPDAIDTCVTNFWKKISQFKKLILHVISSSAPVDVPVSNSSITIVDQIVGLAEPHFASFGKEVRTSIKSLHEEWVDLAVGRGVAERVWAIALGYVVFLVMVTIYLGILNVANVKTAGRAVRSVVRQQLVLVKVAAFILIEVALFPFGCGIVLDLTSIWIFPEANLVSRVLFFRQAPLTALFYHWIPGTVFMYGFSVLVGGCRTLMRPGAMWFIKDPSDPKNANPIKDIIDRSTATQMRKILISATMYSLVVILTVASIGGLLILGSNSVLPFRWRNRDPLTHVPIDLLFMHLILPYTMQHFRPRRNIRKAGKTVWLVLARRLRLSSYFYGTRRPEEERVYKLSLFGWTPVDDDTRDGSFRRVPATDHVALPREVRATAAVTETGEPVDDTARKLMEIQDRETIKAKRYVAQDYMVVYIPPHFRYRIITFLLCVWILGSIVAGVTVAVPILLGRRFFKLFSPYEIHDGYSFLVGFYLLWGCFMIGKAVDRLDKRRQRRGSQGTRGDLRVLVIKRGVLWVTKTAYMVFFLGIIMPILVALVVDLYLVLPFRFAADPDLVARIRIADLWALGLIYIKLASFFYRRNHNDDISRGVNRIIHNGWTHPEPVAATKEVIGPLLVGLSGMIFLPALAFFFIKLFCPSVYLPLNVLVSKWYPAIFIGVGGMMLTNRLMDVTSSWSQAIRDKEFLLEMRLRNHDPEVDKKEKKRVIHVVNT